MAGAPADASFIGTQDVGIEIFVDGGLVERVVETPNGDAGVGLTVALEGEDFRIIGGLFAHHDPFITYQISAVNFTAAPMAFLFAFFSPYEDGPFDTLDSSHASTVTDGGLNPNGSVTVVPLDASGFVHVPQVDGAAVPAANLGDGCSVQPLGPDHPCDLTSSITVGIGAPPPPPNFFAVFVGVNLSPDDTWTASGRIEIRNDVPEPVSLALVGLGFCAVVFARRSA
jgi:hypothetical protein